MDTENLDCRGFCRDCGQEHRLPAAPAFTPARRLMADLLRHGNLGLGREQNPLFDLGYLFGPAGGQMFGVLVYRDRDGSQGVLRAFSGQYNGVWNAPGWTPPIVNPEDFTRTIGEDEARIKDLTRKIQEMSSDHPDRPELLARRRHLSRVLAARIFALYRPANFRGQRKALSDVFMGTGMPSGTGECCAPKLLHHAACMGLRPFGLAEFFLGRENRSGTRRHGCFYPPCAEKCRPILGFLLCGLDT